MDSSIFSLKKYEVNLSKPSKQEIDQYKAMLDSGADIEEVYGFLKDNPSILLYLTFIYEATYVIPDVKLKSESGPCILMGNLYPRGYVWNLIAFCSPQIQNISENQKLIPCFQNTLNAVRLWDNEHPSMLKLRSKFSNYWLEQISINTLWLDTTTDTDTLRYKVDRFIDAILPDHKKHFLHHINKRYILIGQHKFLNDSSRAHYKKIMDTYDIVSFGYNSVLEMRFDAKLSNNIKTINDECEYTFFRSSDEIYGQNVIHLFNPTKYISTNLDERIREWLSYIGTNYMKDRTRIKENDELSTEWYHAYELDKALYKTNGNWDANNPDKYQASILNEAILWIRYNMSDDSAEDYHNKFNALYQAATEYDKYLTESLDDLEEKLKDIERVAARHNLIDNWALLAKAECKNIQIIAGDLINYVRSSSLTIYQNLYASKEIYKIINMPLGLVTADIQSKINELSKKQPDDILGSNKAQKSMRKEVAYPLIFAHLVKRPHDTVVEVSESVGCSTGLVGGSPAWKANRVCIREARLSNKVQLALPLVDYVNEDGDFTAKILNRHGEEQDKRDGEIDERERELNQRISDAERENPKAPPQEIAKIVGCTARDVEDRGAKLQKLTEEQLLSEKEDPKPLQNQYVYQTPVRKRV